MQNLKISLIQTHLHWEDPIANLAHLEEKIWQIDKETDLIVLPEMFSTGFSMDTKKLAEPMNLHSFKWMQKMAAQKKCVITGSLIIKEKGHNYNRLIWMRPDGTYAQYDKRHLFTFASESDYFSAGKERLMTELKGWKILPQICYDLRFPVWSRNLKSNPYDLLIYVANWPETRISAWNALLKARALENASYSIGLNRIGMDGKGLSYSGNSAAYDFLGNALLELKNEDGIFNIELSHDKLIAYRKKFPLLEDQDQFKIL
ncbi:MAG: amidohydrolase [Cytophagales bacterium]